MINSLIKDGRLPLSSLIIGGALTWFLAAAIVFGVIYAASVFIAWSLHPMSMQAARAAMVASLIIGWRMIGKRS